MPHDLTDLIADLDAAKADLARSVKRCRTLIGDRRAPPTITDQPLPDKSVFKWSEKQDR